LIVHCQARADPHLIFTIGFLQADNIFMDMAGTWWLGDLGSAVRVGEKVTSTTSWFSPGGLIGKTAKQEYDWCVATANL
jgi:hypothetical protein